MVAKTILFDLDGTVWNSRPWYAESIAYLSGASVCEIEHRLSTGENIVQLAKVHGVSQPKLIQVATRDAKMIELYEQVRQTLETLRNRKTSLGVVSNLPGWLARPLLESNGLNEYFEIVITPCRGLPAKPKPQGILNALEQIGHGPNASTWFVGDGAVDACAAEAAGVKFVWASYGYETRQPPCTSIAVEKFEDVLLL